MASKTVFLSKLPVAPKGCPKGRKDELRAIRDQLRMRRGKWTMINENCAGPQQIVHVMRQSELWLGFELATVKGTIYARYTGKVA